MLRGSIPALVTIFRDEAFDEGACRDFVAWQIAEGSHGLVPCGTTGEVGHARFGRASPGDRDLRRGRGRQGAGDRRLRLERHAPRDRADPGGRAGRRRRRARTCRLITTGRTRRGSTPISPPSPTAVDIPIVLYNVPSRTVTDISVETMARLAKIANVVAVKDATGNLARVSAQRLACGADFIQLSGNDDMALGFNAMGGSGCISVTANVAPRLCADFQEPAWPATGRARSSSRTASIRSTPPCSATLHRARSNMRSTVSAPISPPTCACR